MEQPVWDRIQQIYYSTLPIDDSRRGAFVEQACESDPLLIKEVTSLLEADKNAGDFLATPLFEVGLKIISSANRDELRNVRPRTTEDLIGSTIDQRYLVEKELGHGGMGAVYLARDLSLHNRPVVIKILLQASLQDPYVVRKFRQEVEALARIDHPSVVNVLGAGEFRDGKPFLVMQYVNGVTLRSQISSEGMNLDRVASLIKQTGEALEDVHEKGIFHRDLKPENIMLQALKGNTELVKIVDFGVAKVKDSVIAPSTADRAPVGTVLYMSPEHLRGEKITAVSDIYSMSVIAYEMVTGRRPFTPSSSAQLLEMQRAGVRIRPADLRTNLSTEAQAIILRGLSFAPEDRYQNASELGEALARTLRDSEASAPAPQTFKQGRPLSAFLERHQKAALSTNPVDGSIQKTGSLSEVSESRSRISMAVWSKYAASVLIISALAISGFYFFRARRPGSAAAPTPRIFSYWLTVQKMRDGRLYQDPFQSSGQEIFENGYKFRLNFVASDPGYLYVLNEGPPEEDGTTLTVVYPTPLRKNAFVSNQPVHTNWNTFRGPAGTENFWIVWSTTPISQLESAKTQAFDNEKGALTDINAARAIKEFLLTHSEPKPESTKDVAAQLTRVTGAGDLVVKLTQLEHR